jgi:fucose permease
MSIGRTLRLPAVWIGIALFFVYTGVEATPGQWTKSLFVSTRGVDETLAATLVSVYWGSFTIGRIFFGAIINRFNPLSLARGCMIGALVGAALLWWSPAQVVGFAGLILLGFAQAPLFPIMVSLTPRTVGAEHAPNAIGFQIAGAGVGIAMLPAFAGILAERIGLSVVPPFVFVCALLLIVLFQSGVTRRAERTGVESSAVPFR